MNFFFNPNQGPGVLTNNVGQPMPQGYMSPIMQAQAMQNGATGNARGSMRMPQMPNNRIGMNEALIRMGGNIVGAAQDGGLAAFKAGTDSFGQVMDYNRQADIDRYNAEYAQAKAEEERAFRERLARMKMKAKKKDEAEPDFSQINTLEGLLRDLQSRDDLTGPWAGTVGAFIDSKGFKWLGADPALAVKRLKLQEIKVDSALAKIAQTKGAISDREMALFLSPTPSISDDEQVWIDWLKPQLEVLKQLRDNGITNEAARQKGINPGDYGGSVDDPGQEPPPIVIDLRADEE
jgi:hypothetical protein